MHKFNFSHFFCTALGAVAFFCMMGCSSALFDAPIVPTSGAQQASATTSATVAPPDSLVATHGSFRSIVLSWDAVPGAVYYYIYAANSPFETFEQIAEVNGSTLSYKHAVAAGTTMYFRVRSVGYNDSVSCFSDVVSGSSLAVPVLSYVEPVADSADSAVTVYWWMSNCTSATYQSAVSYEVSCTAPDGTVVHTVDVSDGSAWNVTVDNLVPNTRYTYCVTATVSSGGSSPVSESCDPIDAETARRLVPEAPVALTAVQGMSANALSLTWTLPPFTDTVVAAGQYERRPVYFKIYRAVSGGEDALLVSYFGSIDALADGSARKVSFASQVTAQPVPDGAEQSELYPGYVPGCTVTWTDTTAKRGVVYTYKVVSFVDGVNREVSSAISVAHTDGWLLAEPTFSVGAVTYEVTDDETANKSGTIPFVFAIDEKDAAGSYVYDLLEHIEPLNDGSTQGKYIHPVDSAPVRFTSSAALSEYVRTVTLPDERGKYSYRVSVVCAADGTVLETVSNPAVRYVTEELHPLVVANMKVTDGYKDKVSVAWTMFENVTYNVETSADGVSGWNAVDVSSVVYNPASPDVSFDIPLDTGSAVYIKITPSVDNNGVTKIGQESLSAKCMTLGVPHAVITARDYDSVTISWAEVPKADRYHVAYSYSGDDGAMLGARVGIDESDATTLLATAVKDDGSFSVELPIKGSQYADMAGLPLTVTVSAVNDLTGAAAITSTATSVVGPAGVATTIIEPADSSRDSGVTLAWKTDPNAVGYFIIRRVLNDVMIPSSTVATYSDPVVYYVLANDATFVANNATVTANVGADSSEVNLLSVTNPFVTLTQDSESVTLVDRTASGWEGTLSTAYRAVQSMLAWGVDCEYLVIPVTSIPESIPIMSYDEVSNTLTDNDSLTYESVEAAFVHGAARGYGRNVTATKGWQPAAFAAADMPEVADNTSVHVTWQAPRGAKEDTLYTVYRRPENSPTAWERVTAACSTLYYDDPAPAGTVYEYCVGINGASVAPHTDSAFVAAANVIMDDGIPEEKRFSGYMLPSCEVSSVSRDASFGMAEQVVWVATGADSATNHRGVDGYAIEVLNLNMSDKWQKVAEYTFGSDSFEKNTQYTKVISSDCLAVLRDYKHYFRVRPFARRDGLTTYAKTPDYTWSDGYETSQVKWGARQLTDAEFAKSVLLVFADGFWRMTGGEKLDGDKTNNEYGSLSLTHKNTIGMGTEYPYTMNGYHPVFELPAGALYVVAPFDITATSSAYRDQLGIKGYVKSFDSVSIAVSLNGFSDEMAKLKTSYTGTVTMKADSSSKLSVSIVRNDKTGTVVNTSSVDERRAWLPVRFMNDSAWFFTNSDYGWWPATNKE